MHCRALAALTRYPPHYFVPLVVEIAAIVRKDYMVLFFFIIVGDVSTVLRKTKARSITIFHRLSDVLRMR
jgi:hypothetical protein